MRYAQVEIIASALEATTREMNATLVRTAFSPNVKERADCSTALTDMQGRTLALFTNAPAHLGATLRLVPEILKRFPLETIRPGDAFLANDPYIVGVTHLNDCTVAAPIFVEGEAVGFSVAVAHHSDVGGRVPGSEAGDSNSIYQEGIRIPPVQIYRAGERRNDIIELFLLNSRTPHFGEGDLLAQMAAADRGIQRVQELFGRVGTAAMLERIDEMLAAAEARTRHQIRANLKPGRYSAEDWLDEDGISDNPIKLAADVTIEDGHIHIDLSRCGKQVASGKNMPWTHTLSTVYYCLKVFTEPNQPINEGLYRCVTVIAPEGSIANCRAPAGVSSRGLTSMILADCLIAALGQAAPQRALAPSGTYQGIILSGYDPVRSRYFIDYENFSGGQGGRVSADGMDAVQLHITNTSNLPIESMEAEFPVRVERYELLPDTGGRGKYRGGLGVVRDLRILAEDLNVATRSARQKFPAAGMAGGDPGSLGAFILNPGAEDERRLPSTKSEIALAKGDLLRILTPGGGGFGPESERDPNRLAHDIADGKISGGSAAGTRSAA
ncbi:hydantoinase B/oxoprolinase family protein [Oceanibaculum pacificum]|uniref:Hydantoinase B/oxoprolinase domain-containing protein n=1 Tax=Oceanibaculum pacificum TaxID=580166 RepID=A0A154W243_9PROT|nr:hydantoinase B/oxoprolinase family protein [Oceanibaculum pacificum]KZD07521.1 hypothetical protein AUP43_10130 [Oceanibaculum pacificum]